MITGLILCGLVIDLGGGPDHERIGFRVSAGLARGESDTELISIVLEESWSNCARRTCLEHQY